MNTDIHISFEHQDSSGNWTILFKPILDEDLWYENIVNERKKCLLSINMAIEYLSENNIKVTILTRDKNKDNTKFDKKHVHPSEIDPNDYLKYGTAILRTYYNSLPKDYILNTFSFNSLVWEFPLPKLTHVDDKYIKPEIRRRDYLWFNYLHQNKKTFVKSGLPSDITEECSEFCHMFGNPNDECCDGHSFGYCMVSDLLNDEKTFNELWRANKIAANDVVRKSFERALSAKSSLTPEEKERAIEKQKCVLYDESENAVHEKYVWLRQFIPDPKNTRMIFYFDN